MRHVKRKILGLVVLVGGLCAALPYYRSPSTPQPRRRDTIQRGAVQHRGDVVLRVSSPRDDSPAGQWHIADGKLDETGRTADPPKLKKQATLDRLAPPPELPPAYSSHTDSPEAAVASANGQLPPNNADKDESVHESVAHDDLVPVPQQELNRLRPDRL